MTNVFSRRGSLGLALCACAAPATFAAAEAPIPPGYTPPTYAPPPGLAPGMKTAVVSGGKNGAPRVWAIIFSTGDEIMSGLTEWATHNGVKGAHLSAIGAFSSALLAWFDLDKKAYRNIPVDEQVECVSLIGDIGLVGDKSIVHVHSSVGFRDGAMKGGHVLKATASPTLEVFVTETDVAMQKVPDPKTDLKLFRVGE